MTASSSSVAAANAPPPPDSSPIPQQRRTSSLSAGGGESPISLRKTTTTSLVTHADMDAVGQFGDTKDTTTLTSNNNKKEKSTPPPSPPMTEDEEETTSRGVEIMEIGHDDDDDDDLDADLERLLGGTTTEVPTTTTTRTRRKCCQRYNIGSTIVVCPNVYERTGYGLIGPHWFGPFCTLWLILWASIHFIRKAGTIGPVSQIICILFFIMTVVLLFGVSCRDPGIVRGTTTKPEEGDNDDWRWCDFCNVYQPPDGAHCPDCNVCVAGYDHHCVWMGTCVGKDNFAAFKYFNVCWLLYLIYSIAWVTILGPSMFHPDNNKEL